MFEELLKRLGLGMPELANALDDIVKKGPRWRPVKVTIAAGATSGEAIHGLQHAHRGAVIVGASGALDKPWIPPAALTNNSKFVRVNVATAPVAAIDVYLQVF